MSIKYFEKLLKSPRSSNDTSRLGYSSTKEGESSKTAEERNNKGKNNKPTYHFCGKRDIHIMYVETRIPISMISLRMQTIVISARNKDIKHMNVELRLSRHLDLKVTATIARSMDIEPLNANQSLCVHQINKQRHQAMKITTIGITTLGIAVITIKNMDMLLKIA